MQNFIVLGIIPGINYQTTFSFWLMIALGFGALMNVPRFVRYIKQLRIYLAARRIAHTIDRYELIAL